MFRSLYSGVSGLAANLTNLDVIGNNIANSNTTGFKSGRVTFNEMLTQTIKSSSRPVAGGMGGTNPQQIGLGVSVGSIDTNFSQGNFQSTGKKSDLAIQGSGFFVLSDGGSRAYTRAGIFGIDSNNTLVNPSTGLRVQGVMADSAGNIGTGPYTDINIDPGLVVPAAPSTKVSLMGNLDSASDAKGTVLESSSFLIAANGTELLSDLAGEGGAMLDLNVGDVVSVNGRVGGVALGAGGVTVTNGMTYQELLTAVNASLAAASANLSVNTNAAGGLDATSTNGGDIDGFSLSVVSNTTFNENFGFPATIAAGGTESSNKSLRGFANENSLLSDVFDSEGNSLGLTTFPTVFDVGGSVGDDPKTPTQMQVTAATTLGDLASEMQYNLEINSNPSEVNAKGQIVLRGEVGSDAAISKISVSEQGVSNSNLTNAFEFAETQVAVDQKDFSMSTMVYDSLGAEHPINFNFEKVPDQNEWIWSAELEGTETLLGGSSGRLSFNETGSITSFVFDDGSSSLTFQPQGDGVQGAENVDLTINFGEIGALTGLTQFKGAGNLQSISDGYGTGTLVDYNIDQSGTITGIFSNDTSQAIAQIGMANFSNADGLTRQANNTYRRSGNSGQALEMFAGTGNGTTLVAGALETSNVDLAKQFTDLVVAQRSFQANSRVITTADQVMQELVNIIR
ncbi:MAG: flagellar hook protein FlgE [Candidatus Krumholzibacteriia bacterium]|jgi:flagellar hook protein FlgE